MPGLLGTDDDTIPARSLLQIQDPNAQPDTSWAAAMVRNYQAVSDLIAQQQAKSAQMGLWDETTGLPTAKGAQTAGQQVATGLLAGTTSPGFRAFHGSPADFERFDAAYLHPDEAGHYFAQDESTARDYAGRSARDPTAGHMYEVNINADLAKFLDYGSLHPTDQAALNAPGAVQKLRDTGVPGIKFPDGTHVVFNDSTIDILRKYGIAGLIAGGGAAAAVGNQPQQ